MKKLNWDLMKLTQGHREGSYGTQAMRWRDLNLMANQLEQLGFKNLRAKNLKPRHVEALIRHWREQKLSIGSIKNHMSHLRWWTNKLGISSVIPKDNHTLGIEDRTYVTNVNKAVVLTAEQLSQVQDAHIAVSLKLQEVFGLRREEAMKLQPSYADRADTLVLKSSWTKGGRPREIPIRTEEQRRVLDQAHQLAGKGSMIPPERSYKTQVGIYERECRRIHLENPHGLRHAYAQTRYEEITGWKCPVADGPHSGELKGKDRETDQEAREQISKELGHNREQVTAIYLGR